MENLGKTNERGFSSLEMAAYGIMAVVVVVGIILAQMDEQSFRDIFVREDGVLEYFTALALFASALLSLRRLAKIRLSKGLIFVVMTGLTFLVMLFGAGEEISWGQRIFDIQSGEFFSANNAQNETNLHNLTVKGVNINKLIFGKLLTLFLVLYYLILPYVFARNSTIHDAMNRLFIPVPKWHHGIALLIAGLSILLVASTKKGELNEVCLSIVFFLTLYGPQNRFIFNGQAGLD